MHDPYSNSFPPLRILLGGTRHWKKINPGLNTNGKMLLQLVLVKGIVSGDRGTRHWKENKSRAEHKWKDALAACTG
jgi:hypothetical protein